VKAVCTASIFAALLTALFCSFWFEVPEYTWWGPDWMNHHDRLITVFTWFNNNLLMPATAAILAGLATFALWKLSEALCTKLRKAVGK